jgi:hypothetical protein
MPKENRFKPQHKSLFLQWKKTSLSAVLLDPAIAERNELHDFRRNRRDGRPDWAV